MLNIKFDGEGGECCLRYCSGHYHEDSWCTITGEKCDFDGQERNCVPSHCPLLNEPIMIGLEGLSVKKRLYTYAELQALGDPIEWIEDETMVIVTYEYGVEITYDKTSDSYENVITDVSRV